ncbi:DNA translocase FtsK [Bacillus sp. ISL-40]|uniref:DNA translocase FtsK n=1 Tax=unclassified Bacillus (in: firmicutes) TaxID=185979 RepID=UPI001BEC8A23|nr:MULTISPECIES: DNA translocase FtsK [unclassified Bacillus (in: firmicutes)]MBT2697622.1 DNA translocase FtsK [Bacillus sp. ISL-40]MBT2744627.1 DNA translocase FtsK [Bacillus sp. ISL-77]
MSWFQNFFQRLKKEEDDEEFDGYILHKHEGPPLLNKYENLKDLDTKISYQYPKGSNRPSYTPIPKVTQKVKEETLRQKRTERLPEKRKMTEKSVVQTVKKEVPKSKQEPLPKKRGPFQPTEIPSPVFGFNQRPKNTDIIVEHELSHFLNDDVENRFDSLVVSKEMMTETEKTVPFVNDEELLEVETTWLEINQEEQVGLIEEKPSSELLEHTIEEIAPIPMAEIQIELVEVEEEVTQEEVTEEVTEEESTEEVTQEESSEEREEDSIEEVKELIAVSTESIEEAEVVEALPEPPAPKRSNLPFNVMMLKQDKQKWEERKRKRGLEQPSEVPTENKQAEKVSQVIDLFPIKEKESLTPTDDGYYVFPTDSLLNPPVTVVNDTKWLLEQEEILNETLQNFNVGASVVNVTQGPSVTRFEVQPEPGVKVNKITNLSDDIKLSLAARDIRIEAPIPGKHTIGIEVPNQKSRPVFINEIIQSSIFKESTSPLTAVLGLDIAGKPIVTDLKKMPHGLIAGATGSGKSVCINTILVSLLFKASPEDLKLLLIDPKMVELAPYNRIPHLVSPVITDVKAATAALKWAVDEMERRYELFAHTGVRDINRFNELAIKHKQYSDKLPFIVIVIDELADLMMMSPADVEEAICRIAQKARACGIHLIVATQRPSVDVITGLIKANIPTRVAFSVSSQVDSRTIIDISGAEKLLGRGDMLFLENGSSKPVRLQGTFVSDEEIDLVVGHVREQREPEYLFEQEELLKKAQVTENEDELFYEACEFIIDQGGASTSSLQRRFKIGYNRAARLMDMLETHGYITSANGSKAREVLITLADLESIQDASANN